jgi:hypothetical protein
LSGLLRKTGIHFCCNPLYCVGLDKLTLLPRRPEFRMSRFDELTRTVEIYQKLAAENYDRIRTLAEDVRAGLCDYIGAADGVCVHLVPPAGPFEPRAYGDAAFSVAPRGFRPLGPIAFGLAIRISSAQDWMRIGMECRKSGDAFIVAIEGGKEYTFTLLLTEADTTPFFEHLYVHVLGGFAETIESYNQGDYGSREIGFDIAAVAKPA